MLHLLKNQVANLGKVEWHQLLEYLADLHENRIHPPCDRLPYMWEQVGSSESLGISFGNWDSVHIALDTLRAEPEHALRQVDNILALQEPSGLIPGTLWLVDDQFRFESKTTCPPLWPIVVEDYLEDGGNLKVISPYHRTLVRQLRFFEAERASSEGGFYYLDLLDRFWESGMQESIRYDLGSADCPEQLACVDASSHVLILYRIAARWSALLGLSTDEWTDKAEHLQQFIEDELWDNAAGIFKDHWQEADPPIAIETIWPLVAGAASYGQACIVIDRHLLSQGHFLSEHPPSTISQTDLRFSESGFRGPARNSLTYWAARACLNYGRKDAAEYLIEKALDNTAKHFEATGDIWDAYPASGVTPVLSIPGHLGHNPLIAMAEIWDRSRRG